MNTGTLITLIILACSFASLQNVDAQIPRMISFQGVLADAKGNLVPDGNHQLQIVLYDQATNGNQVFVENQTIPVVKGIFNVIIGSVAVIPQSLSFDRAYFLGVSVDGGSELTPRTALTSVPYALRAERANIAESLSPNAAVVTRMNNQSGDVTLLGAGSTTVTNNGSAFTISSTGTGGTGIQGVQSTDGTISIQNPNGPVATIGLNDGAITDSKLATGQVVKSINTLKDDVTLTAGSNVTIIPNGNALTIAATGGGSSGVSSINNANGALTLAASGGATVSTNGKTITINAGSGSGGTGIQGIQNTDNTLDITNPGGPTATINVKNQGITTTKLADGSVTNGKISTGQVVKSINTLKDDVTFAAGNNVTITPSGNTLTISATGGSTNYWSANGNDISNTNSGNVGIGTSNPAVKLDVNGSLNANSGATITGTNGDGAVITARRSGGDPFVIIDASAESQNSVLAYRKNNLNRWLMYADHIGSDFRIDAYNNAGIGIATRLLIQRATGNVGIGTEVLSSKLNVENTTTGGIGIYGHSTATSGGGIGVYGNTDSNTGFGVFSGGNMGASGTKPFRIDHPKDPTGRYLLHYSAEGPDVLNIYTGNVFTDANGYASITLPDYFDEINKEPRYSLTVINEGGTDFVQTMVVQEIRNNQFAIRTSKPSVKVSWEVKALRNDLWVRTYGAPVQVEKQGSERGKYQHPELYGMPKEMGTDYHPQMEKSATASPAITPVNK